MKICLYKVLVVSAAYSHLTQAYFHYCCLFYQGKSCFQLCAVLSPGEDKNFLCIFHECTYVCMRVT